MNQYGDMILPAMMGVVALYIVVDMVLDVIKLSKERTDSYEDR
jgi:hypothetical protein